MLKQLNLILIRAHDGDRQVERKCMYRKLSYLKCKGPSDVYNAQTTLHGVHVS